MKKYTVFALAIAILTAISCKKDDNETKEVDPVAQDTAFVATTEIPSELDSLMMTVDQYHISLDSAVIVLCHQAGWSRGEYKEIAPKLNALGYNCIALDQRSGGTINGVKNETNIRALDEGKGTSFIDAKPDIVGAVLWAKNRYKGKVLLWGSSYSSSLALIVAKERAEVDKVLSFSPGEYLNPIKVGDSVDGLDKPAFLTSSKSEASQTKAIYDRIVSSEKVHFIPNGNGEYGSRALWEEKADYKEYWTALEAFLKH